MNHHKTLKKIDHLDNRTIKSSEPHIRRSEETLLKHPFYKSDRFPNEDLVLSSESSFCGIEETLPKHPSDKNDRFPNENFALSSESSFSSIPFNSQFFKQRNVTL